MNAHPIANIGAGGRISDPVLQAPHAGRGRRTPPHSGGDARRLPLFSICACILALVAAPFAFAQPQNQRTAPHLAYAYPAGGKQGSTVTISVGGQNLNGTTDAYFSGAGITARVVSFDRPMTQKEFNDLREKAQEMQQKRAAAMGRPAPEPLKFQKKDAKAEKPEEKAPLPPSQRPKWTAADEQALAEIRAQLAKRPNRNANPALAETITLEVQIAPDTQPGSYELRLKSPAGMSNPMVLQVGELPEHTKPVVTATMNVQPRKKDPSQRPNHPQAADAEIALPIVVNGQILPGDVDRYRFAAKKGQHLTVAVNARTLIPYLADAVPGWFQATLALYDPRGHEVAYSDSFRFSPDPVVSYEIPEDGMYAVEIKDSIYRGREDFVYRIAIGELPFVTSIFPLGGHFADSARFELSGWNLPGKVVAMDTKDKTPGQFLLSIRNRGQLSNPIRFALDREPSCLEQEPNDGREAGQKATLPMVIDGRIGKPGDQDTYRFEGKAGDEIVAEVFARRLGSPLDSILKVTDATGKQLAVNDDNEDKGVGLMTHHADSRVTLKLPADGTYFASVEDTQRHGGPEYSYRLRLSPPRPDFELRVTPSTVNLRAGTHVPITVYALRRDGFEGEIVLSMQDAPAGFALSGARIPAGQDKVQMTLTASSSAREQPFKLALVGAAVVAGKPVARLAVPADDMMQAFAYHHLVPAKEWLVHVMGRPAVTCRLLTRGPLKLAPGGTAKLVIGTTSARNVSKVAIELSDPPEGISVKEATTSGDTIEVVIACDPAKVKPGLRGNLILNAFGERAAPKAPKGARPQRQPLGSVPAVPFEVTGATSVATK